MIVSIMSSTYIHFIIGRTSHRNISLSPVMRVQSQLEASKLERGRDPIPRPFALPRTMADGEEHVSRPPSESSTRLRF